MKDIFQIIIIFFMIFFMTSCNKSPKRYPNRVYMPDMYYSDAYEPYSDPYFSYNKKYKKINIPIFNKNQTSSLLPAKNSIPRKDFYENISYDVEYNGFDYSKKIHRSPIMNIIKKDQIMKDGKILYQINCAICHGNEGDGQGILVKNEKILGVPSYKERDITVGSVYYVITFGKNSMGSYSSQLNKIDRWKVSEYVISSFKK
ncbi:c-type cytochrome [Blattabacterium cuenoti]|uniref:c-type cytochrome n=1 Tax=Blattabacterium cuenoti TaxID=1653831 RepID=UPI00163B870F|nr:cytochrome c [Blattabacterium cuenoti]